MSGRVRGAGRVGPARRSAVGPAQFRTSRVAGTSVLTERLRALGGVGMHNLRPPRFDVRRVHKVNRTE